MEEIVFERCIMPKSEEAFGNSNRVIVSSAFAQQVNHLHGIGGITMKIETLREFVVLIKCGSFSRAAKELFLSQPSLSTHISAMEKELGFELVERTTAGFLLTSAGAAFLEYAQVITSTYEEAVEECKAAAREIPPIRMQSLPPSSPLAKKLAGSRDPRVSFVDTSYNVSTLDALERGLIDIGTCADFTVLPSARKKAEEASVAFVRTGFSKAAIAMMKSNPLATKQSLASTDIDGATVSIGGYAYFDEWRSIVDAMMGPDVHLKYQLSPIESRTDLAFEDLGMKLHICGDDAIGQQYINRDDIVAFRQLDGKELEFPTGFAYRIDAAKDGRMDKLIEILEQHLGNDAHLGDAGAVEQASS